MQDTQEKPGVEEQYLSAGNTGNLKVDAERRGAGDVLIAAGSVARSTSALGMALLRLHSEWDGAAKRNQGKMTDSDYRILANSLKSRPVVWAALVPWMVANGIAHERGEAALLHWLNPTCAKCGGLCFLKAANAPHLTARRCNRCYGEGKLPPPRGTKGVLVYLDECTQAARTAIKRRLRP